jgi:hypothetical protein
VLLQPPAAHCRLGLDGPGFGIGQRAEAARKIGCAIAADAGAESAVAVLD